MFNNLKIAVVGAGNVGRTLSVMLSSNNYNVEAVIGVDPSSIHIDNSCAYDIDGDFGKKTHLVHIVPNVADLSDDIDIIFVCTKIFDAVPLLRILRKKIKPDGAIVTIQNLFWIDRMSKLVHPKNSVCMYLDFACVTKHNVTYVKNFDGIKLGIYNKDAYPALTIVHEVLSSFCKVTDVKDIIGFSIGRSIINTTINSLGAISGYTLREILLDRNGKYLFKKLISEEVNLFNKLNIKICPYDNKLDYYLFTENSFRGKIYRSRIFRLLRINNGNVVSTALRDFEYNRKSELLVVLDSFVKHAGLKHLRIPYTKEIFEMLKEISHGKRRIHELAFYEKRLVNIGEWLW